MKIFSSNLGKKVDLKPLADGKVGMYVCGPTVYDLAHLGHGRSAVSFDVMRRYFLFKGYDVKYVSNYTDIDDKMINRAEEEKISVAELAERIIPEYEKDYAALGIMKPDVLPRATEYIEEMIEIIRRLEGLGHTYLLDDGVYFDVATFEDYGKFSGQNLDELKMGARVDVKEGKRNPQDFVLWKFKKEGEPFWTSQWGEGRPGWHIECSAMSFKNLGEQFDIHGGGLDLKFPHHECEVAQSLCAFGSGNFAKYWLHNGFINVDNVKMSKSLGNFFTLRDIFSKYKPQVVRLMYLQTHYRNPINFSAELLDQAKAGLERIHTFVMCLKVDYEKLPQGNGGELYGEKCLEDFVYYMDDDFNTSGALEAVFSLIFHINSLRCFRTLTKDEVDSAESALKSVDKVLSLIFFEEEALSSDIEALIEEREEARKAKNFKRSDEIRDQLLKEGIVLEDTSFGTVWKRT
ncbi:cysteine--tRNA ligase [Candidatus Peregrinibacteria bacterium]|nr:cysteine--tRNA ligase [Candidatus Peregrinibacteria bacterium]